MKKIFKACAPLFAVAVLLASCTKNGPVGHQSDLLTVENVLDSKPLVESGTFQGTGSPALVLPGESVSFTFSAAKNQRVSFGTMYGWSNDLFFAAANPGIKLYEDDGTPITGDVSPEIKLWDNGTRVNQVPGMNVIHPGTAETTQKNIEEVNGQDDYGNSYLPASQLMNVSLAYNGNSMFTVTITNNSGGTANETPFSPGVWAISYTVGGNLLLPQPVYSAGQPTANGLTSIAEMGNNVPLSQYLTSQTGIFTPLSPVLVVVFQGSENPFYKPGEKDRGEGLMNLAQQGNADILAASLMTKKGIKNVYVLKDPTNTVLLPRINGAPGGKVSQLLSLSQGDKIAIATMYGFSNDWFFATTGNDINQDQLWGKGNGDVSSLIGLFDDGTAINQFPGAGVTQFNLAGTPLEESKPIEPVPNPNAFTTLPPIPNIIRVTLSH